MPMIFNKSKIGFLILISILSVLGLANSALARNAYYTRQYYIQLHFDNMYNGQPIKSVLAHIGVQKGKSWFDTQDIELQFNGKDFNNKTGIIDRFDSADPEQYLLVTYLVTLASGENIWTPVSGVESKSYGTYYEGCESDVSDCYGPRAQSVIKDLKDKFSVVTPTQTKAEYFTTYH